MPIHSVQTEVKKQSLFFQSGRLIGTDFHSKNYYEKMLNAKDFCFFKYSNYTEITIFT